MAKVRTFADSFIGAKLDVTSYALTFFMYFYADRASVNEMDQSRFVSLNPASGDVRSPKSTRDRKIAHVPDK